MANNPPLDAVTEMLILSVIPPHYSIEVWSVGASGGSRGVRDGRTVGYGHTDTEPHQKDTA